jgi:succinyl-CoA:acetate CoA-transferase
VDVAVVEAMAITEEGHLVPSTSVGNAPSALRSARRVIIEVNEAQPAELEGMHDIFIPGDPPHKLPVLIGDPSDRIGTPHMEVPADKVAAVVLTSKRDSPRGLAEADEASEAISRQLIEFFLHETKKGRLPPNLLPLQSGVGNVANSVLKGFLESSFSGLSFYSEVIQDGAIDLIDAGKFRIASGTALSLSPERLDTFISQIRDYRRTIILRPQEISNCPEVISRIGVIAINTAVEADIYGNVNSSHITGSRLMNGIGGSGDFARSAYLCIFSTPSIKGGGAISPIVPLVSHIDHTEHDVDVLVTDQGLADLRGLGPVQRARAIIDNCVHPMFRDKMEEYWSEARRSPGHIPIDLARASSWHVSFLETKRMV